MKIYGSRVSYYTGKLETYLRYRKIPYELIGMPYGKTQRITDNVGVIQMPVVECDDGRWMSDTTPILLELEKDYADHPIMPADPVVAFIARLIEDYADEWLWRAAMHYRWSYPYARELISGILVDEVTQHVRAPRFLKRRRITKRQINHFVKRDGVNDQTRSHVEQGYFSALDNMSAMLAGRPFLLGDAPSLADFGLMAPMLRHFGQDPEPEEIMRGRAPAVYEWVARMWNVQMDTKPKFIGAIPDDTTPMLKEICETHLEQLTANAAAFGADKKRFEMTAQGCRYTDLPVSRYRVWCLEQLRANFAALSPQEQETVKALLPHDQAAILWAAEIPAVSDYDKGGQLPFGKAINVYTGGIP